MSAPEIIGTGNLGVWIPVESQECKAEKWLAKSEALEVPQSGTILRSTVLTNGHAAIDQIFIPGVFPREITEGKIELVSGSTAKAFDRNHRMGR